MNRSERIYKLKKELDNGTRFIKNTQYSNPKDLLADVDLWLSIEKEIEVQQAYQWLENQDLQ